MNRTEYKRFRSIKIRGGKRSENLWQDLEFPFAGFEPLSLRIWEPAVARNPLPYADRGASPVPPHSRRLNQEEEEEKRKYKNGKEIQKFYCRFDVMFASRICLINSDCVPTSGGIELVLWVPIEISSITQFISVETSTN